MRWNMGSWRLWLFRGLVAIIAGLMIASFIMPWWIADFGGGHTVNIYGYGLSHNLEELASYVAGDITPFYQTVLAWIYLTASVGLILFSTWLRGRKGQLLLGGIGLIHIAYVAIAVFVVISGRLADFDISLQGWSTLGESIMTASVYTTLRFGYYLTYVAGGMCIALALLRDIIVGRPNLSA